MTHINVELMSQLTELSEEEIRDIEESFPIKTFSKGTLLLKEGQIAVDAFYVIEGCIRSYELADGEEKTMEIYTEGDSAMNYHSLYQQLPSRKFFVCMEETTVAVLNSEREKLLYQKHPRFETFCRKGMEEMMGNEQERLAKFMVMSPEERYLNLLKERPFLLNRVPHYHIASYLGIKPETLSRIRKRVAVNGY